MIKKKSDDSTDKVPVKSHKEPAEKTKRPVAERARYREPLDIFREFEHDFDEFRRSMFKKFWTPSISEDFDDLRPVRMRKPLLDIEDRGNELVLRAEIPGVQKENISVEVTENSVELTAKSQTEVEDKNKDYYRRERHFTSFHRHLELPEEVLSNKATATFKNGLLEITMPKKKPVGKEKAVKVKIK